MFITICSNNNDVLIWDHKDNKYNKSNNVIISQTVHREMSKHFNVQNSLLRVINKDSFNLNLNALFYCRSIEKVSSFYDHSITHDQK